MLFKKPKIIVAAGYQGVIAVDNAIPWKKKADLKRFKDVTMGSTLIMGRKTWDSIGRKHLPGRRTVVMSRTIQSDVMTAKSMNEAIFKANDLSWSNVKDVPWEQSSDIWVAGGSEIYDVFIYLIDEIDFTQITDYKITKEGNSFKFFKPFIDSFLGFKMVEARVNPEDSTIMHYKYVRV